MRKRILSLILAAAMAISVNNVVLADPLQNQLQDQQNQLQQDKSALKVAQDKREEMENNVQKLDHEIEGLMTKVNDTKKQIDKTNQDIKDAEKDIKKSEDDMKDEQELFDKRIRAMYKSGTDSYLMAILNSEGLSDFLSRLEAIKKVIEFDNKIIADLKAKKEDLNKKKDALNTENAKLLVLKADSEKDLAKLSETKKSQDKLLSDLKAQEKIFASKVSQSNTLVNATKKQIEDIRKGIPAYTPSRGSAPISSNAVIAYASNFLGTPYQWGATGTQTFDCSGFTQYVFRHFGVSIGRTTYDQINDGVGVSRDNLQPGDLVFFGSYSNPHHVGIYVGNNCYIHAPQTGDVVKISAMTRSDFVVGRRVQ